MDVDTLENEILCILKQINYHKEKEELLLNSVPTMTKLVAWLTNELAEMVGLDNEVLVHAVNSKSELPDFHAELSGFLREYECSHKLLMEGNFEGRFTPKINQLLLLHFLLTELQAVRIIAVSNPLELRQSNSNALPPSAPKVSEQASSVPGYLKRACKALCIPKPPANVTSKQLIQKMLSEIQKALDSAPKDHLSSPVLTSSGALTDHHWILVDKMISLLNSEYKTRRETLLKRLDVTIQSLKWSDKAKRHQDKITARYNPLRRQMMSEPQVSQTTVLAARTDPLLLLHRTSTGAARLASECRLNKVTMGPVPDRGGRAWEMEPPPPEMPAFQKRTNASGDNRGRGGGRHDGHPRSAQHHHDNRGRGGNRGYDRPNTSHQNQYDHGYRQQPQSYRADMNSGFRFDQSSQDFRPQYNASNDNYRSGGRGRGNRT